MLVPSLLRGLTLLLTSLGVVSSALAAPKTIPVRVTAAKADCREAPVSVLVPERIAKAGVHELPKGTEATICQSEAAGKGMVRLTFFVRDLKKGDSRTYELQLSGTQSGSGVEIKPTGPDGKNRDILINGALFTRYDTTTGPNKPYFYPLNGPTGKSIVRHWPVETIGTETHDHPHHRGMWFTHGLMNGVDFWTEGKKTGKTVHTGYDATEGGPVFGLLSARADWITPDGKKLAEDTREIRVYPVAGGYLMDFTVSVKAVGGPLVWGDTKEGTFGIRVADSMRADIGKGKVAEGKIVNAEGKTQDDTWGKASPWCDYYGPVEGETVGIAIFDDPKNPRFPTTWHVRSYGLFAVNAFGLHEFDSAKKNDLKAGDLTTPDGQTTTFHYRLFFHKGDTQTAGIPAVWTAFSDPPTVELIGGGR